jgi:uncharacterized protein YqfB (UPF0267 family)
MKKLHFKRAFRKAVLSGQKTSTLRRWRHARVKEGDTVLAPGVGTLVIRGCEAVDFEKLNRADARADGFDSIAELWRAVESIYPDFATDGKQWFRVRFAVQDKAKLFPSPSTPGEGKGGGGQRRKTGKQVKLDSIHRSTFNSCIVFTSPHPCPPPAYQGRERDAMALGDAREQLATAVRAELDKAVRLNGSLATL